jgi:hypothetical protein
MTKNMTTKSFTAVYDFHERSPHKNCRIEIALTAAVSDLKILGPSST